MQERQDTAIKQLLDEIVNLACVEENNAATDQQRLQCSIVAMTAADQEEMFSRKTRNRGISTGNWLNRCCIKQNRSAEALGGTDIDSISDNSESDQVSRLMTPNWILDSSESSPTMDMSRQELDSLFETSLSCNPMYDSDDESITAALERDSLSSFGDEEEGDFQSLLPRGWDNIQAKETCLNSESSESDYVYFESRDDLSQTNNSNTSKYCHYVIIY